MMRTILMVVGFGLLAGPLAGQVRPDPDRLRAQIVQRFIENYRSQAGLTDTQFQRFQESVRQQWEARRALEQREREIVQALGGQLRPGVAADQDSVTALLDGLVDVRARQAERMRAEQAEYAQYLSPVQRAQLVMSFARLEQQIEDIIRQRMENRQQLRRN